MPSHCARGLNSGEVPQIVKLRYTKLKLLFEVLFYHISHLLSLVLTHGIPRITISQEKKKIVKVTQCLWNIQKW
jgi:predicted component of type VI protein secretion system